MSLRYLLQSARNQVSSQMEPSAAIDLLGILVSTKATGSADTIETVFQLNIQKLIETLKLSDENRYILDSIDDVSFTCDGCCPNGEASFDHHWCFIQWILKLLTLLGSSIDRIMTSEELKVPEETLNPVPPVLFSVSQKQTVELALQFVFNLSIAPCLLSGVGIPAERRTRFSASYKSLCDSDASVKTSRLLKCLQVMIDFISKPTREIMKELILPKHLNDLLAALCQICYAPLRNKCNPPSENIKSEDLRNFEKILDEIMDKSYQPMVIREILLLKSGPPPLPNQRVQEKTSRPPLWLRKICGTYLQKYIMKPYGIQSVFLGMCDEFADGGIKNMSINWRKSNAVAQVIVGCPLQGYPVESYYECIARQILDLLCMKEGAVAKVFITNSPVFLCTLVKMMTMMLTKQPDMSKKLLIDPFIRPFVACLDNSEICVDGRANFISEKELAQSIEDIERIFVSNSEPEMVILANCFVPVIHVLFSLYCYTRNAVTYLKIQVEKIIQWLFDQFDTNVAVLYLKRLALDSFTDESDVTWKRMHNGLKFSAGSCGGIVVVIDEGDKFSNIVGQCEELASCVIGLILLMKQRDEVAAEMILLCLKKLTQLISTEVDMANRPDIFGLPFSMKNSSKNDCFDESSSAEIELLKTNLTLLYLLQDLLEKFSHLCMTKASQIFSFVQATLERGIKILQSTSDELFGVLESETLSLAMGLLTALLSDRSKLSAEDWIRADELAPLLQHIAEHHPMEEVQEMAMDLRIAIATHGLVFTKHDQNTANVKPNKNKAEKIPEVPKTKRPLIEELNTNAETVETESSDEILREKTAEVLKKMNIACETSNSELKTSKFSFSQAVAELCDPLIPVRGHGLIMLHKLIKSNDMETLNKKEIVLKICKINLNHTDSYIYLNAILALAALGDRFPQLVLLELTEEYSKNTKVADGRISEVRMKLGEILVKISTGLGEILPHYKDLLLASVLNAAKDPDCLVRASAVSNLGQICQLLHYSIGSVMYEIFDCIQTLIKQDSSVEVRRAAAMFSTLLLRGLSRDSFKVLDKLLLDFYRLLKFVYTVEKDDTVRLHIQLTLEELDIITKDLLFPKQTFEKRILVLDPINNFNM